MLKRTHFTIGLAVALYFLPFVNHEFIFLPVVLIASFLPEIESGFRFKGKRIFKSMNSSSSHRGLLHTYTFCVAVSLVFAFFYPVVALPFFLGYSFHLFADSFTREGIRPFWPLKMKSGGVVVTGGPVDRALFVAFGIVDAVLLVALLF